MIEQGLVKLVQDNSGVAAIATQGGGFLVELPKGQVLPSWTYQRVSTVPNTTLLSTKGLRIARFQIDCYGAQAADALNLRIAIANVLDGYQGTLPDPDSTFVSSCIPSDEMDYPYDEASRTWRSMLEYEIAFAQI